MATAPLASVIIPNYNYARVLRQCLRAVQAQTYQPIEIVLVDDCSTDDSVAVAESLGVRVISPPSNGGVCAARNLGVAHARGEILFFLDSDVALDPGAVAKAVEVLRSGPRIGAVCGIYDTVPLTRDSLVKEYRNLFRHYWMKTNGENSVSGFLNCAIIAVPAAVWAEVGPWDPQLIHSEGLLVIERLTERYEVRLDSAIRGRHDDDATLGIALRKVFTRTHQHVPFFLLLRNVGGVVGSSESGASLAAVLAVLTLPAALLSSIAWAAALPPAMVAACLAVHGRLYPFGFRTRAAAFWFFFFAVHFVVYLAIAAGV